MGEDYTYEQPAVIAVRGTDLDALRQRVEELEQELASTREDLCDVLEVCIARGDSLGYCDDDYRQWLDELRPESTAIAFEVTE